MQLKSTSLLIAALLAIGFSVATAAVVHHNDQVKNDQAMMESTSMQKKAIQKAATDAAMKQAEADKMTASHGDAMMHDTPTTTEVTAQ